MFDVIKAAGWPIWPILIASVFSLAIIVERLWSLRYGLVAPRDLLPQVVAELNKKGANAELVSRLAQGPLLGRIFAAGLRNVKSSRDVMKEAIEEAGRAGAHELERFLTSLGTIAAVAPLLGLLGTVIGMVELFGAQTPGDANPAVIAHGISVALYNTASGLIVAIPSMIFYRFFRGKVESLLMDMEQQAIKLVELVHGERK
ncbi:MAG: MotA/TolQ/ExbB proton channel family protein [Betaproteobacteria bacterium]|nr:MotA/TolQ/ExbB proton channel family protein [Betaproteobacteria bacterium]